MFKMEFKFSRFLAIRSKALCLGLSEQAKRLIAQSAIYALFSHSCLLFSCLGVVKIWVNYYFYSSLWCPKGVCGGFGGYLCDGGLFFAVG